MGSCFSTDSTAKKFDSVNSDKSLDLSTIDNIQLFSYNNMIFNAYVCDIYDGDTITCIFKYHDTYNKYKIRMLGYDSPEMKPSTDMNENKRNKIITDAKKAKAYLENLILNKWIILECGKFDKYGRILGKIKLDNSDKLYINELMVNNGFGIPYFGGKKT